MSITGFNKIFTVESSEYGYAASSFKPVHSGKNISIYVPKIMGAITGTGKDTIVANKMFDNDDACKITYSKTVNRAKAFSPTVDTNCNWLDKLNSAGLVPKGTRFNVEFLNGNIATPYVTTK
jgi:tricorn protease-like protein